MRRRVPALLLALTLAGCGGVPRSSEVISGSRIEDDPRVGLLQVIPDGPVAGAGPSDVVRGFLLAGSASDEDHGVAREFLATAAAQTWRPDASTTIVTTTPELTVLAQDAGTALVGVRATVSAVVDDTGHYVEQPPGTVLDRQIRLVLQDGQWRLADPADGTVITRLDASRSLRSFPVYFVTDGPSPQLVGDVRWFAYDSSTATRIVRAMLDGPSSWLLPAVTTGAPGGTRLRVDTVPVAAGTATIDLTDAALDADPTERSELLAQLRASLTGLPGVSDVAVTVDGAELTRTGQAVQLPRSVAPVDGRPVVLGPDGLSRWDSGGLRVVASTGPGLDAAGGASDPAAAPDASAYAVLTDDRRVARIQLPGGTLETAVSGRGTLVPPSIDRFGWMWTAPTAAGQAPVVVPVTAASTPAAEVEPPADGLGGALLQARVSRDGARLLVVVEDAAGVVHVRVHGIVRDGAGRPLRLGAPGPDLVPGVGDVLDAAWLVDDQFVVLVRPATGDPVPVLGEVAGPSSRLPAVPGAVSVSGGRTDRDLLVGTADGNLLSRSGADWIVVAQGRDPSYPG
jgi:hypothetical protein